MLHLRLCPAGDNAVALLAISMRASISAGQWLMGRILKLAIMAMSATLAGLSYGAESAGAAHALRLKP